MEEGIRGMAGKVKIRTLSNFTIIVTVALAVLCVAVSSLGFTKYSVLRSATQDYISCESAAKELQEGSDTLTKQVRLATATGEQKYIDAYFEEANVVKSREKALDDLAALDGSPEAMDSLKLALSESVKLMQTEYYSMRLVEEAINADASVWAEEIKNVELSEEDKVLSPKDKLVKAQKLVIDIDYENAKEEISTDVNAALDKLTEEIVDRQSNAADIFSNVFETVILCVVIFALMMLVVCLIMRYWVVKPLLNYNDCIQHGEIFKINGANELQTLAKTYNSVYKENEERSMLMKHKAEHDPLTDLLNRGSFDKILSLFEKDKSNFALILIDVDTFKSVNDTYGHAVGDIILKRVAELLTTAFRSIDYVCRIGGDEFAVIMADMTTDLSYTITDKIDAVNRQLAVTEEGIPAVSLSVGVAFTDRKNPGEDLFKDADSALYYTKEHGKHSCSFYPAE